MAKRRRTKGEGSIIKTTNGKYRVRLDCGYIDGKRKQLSATCSTLVEARVKLREFEKMCRDCNVAASIEMTLEQLITYYLDYKRKKEEIKETTFYNYQIRLKSLPSYLLTKSLCKLTPELFDRYIDDMKAKGSKSSSIKTVMTILRCLLNFAVNTLKILPSNPAKNCKKVNSPDSRKLLQILSEAEHRRIREYLADNYKKECELGKKKPKALSFMYIAYMIAYELGMREGEILGLRWSRVNFEESTITVDNQRVYISNKGSFNSRPKSDTSIRVLVISKGLLTILKEYKERFHHLEEDDYIFSKDIRGTKTWPRTTLLYTFKNTLKAVGITRHFTFHMIRHTNATRLIEKTGNDYKTVSERLGHSSIAITVKVYAHIIEKQHQLAAQLIDCTQ